GIVVVDEAYADFATGSSAIRLIKKYPNLVILRTFSKAWGLAAARVGMAFADPFIISLLDKVKYPYNISSPAANEILQKLKQDPSTVDQSVREIIDQREWLREQLGVKPCVKTVYPSEGNFLLVKVIDARTMYQYLSDRHIIVRDRSKQPLCDNCLRITVGTAEENQRLLDALEAFSQPDSAGQHPNDTQTTEN
ncbi:MAG: aminotransferase class I/II-fold pyridoxal phosphate-dependent enzyme, partial [Bacteroidales bacterium]|nr:aminotransferase class I/II-fold pyridoxal phosphate-dependent enzyme [Bacteroidales bacterium]